MFLKAQTLLSTIWLNNDSSSCTLLLTWKGRIIETDGLICALAIHVDDLRCIVGAQPWILFHYLLQISCRITIICFNSCCCICGLSLIIWGRRINQGWSWHHLLLPFMTDLREHLLNLWTLEYLFKVIVRAGQLDGRCQLLIKLPLIRFEVVDLCHALSTRRIAALIRLVVGGKHRKEFGHLIFIKYIR